MKKILIITKNEKLPYKIFGTSFLREKNVIKAMIPAIIASSIGILTVYGFK